MAEFNKLNSEAAKLMIEAEKLRAETLKIQNQNQNYAKWYPWLPIVLSLLAIAVTFFK